MQSSSDYNSKITLEILASRLLCHSSCKRIQVAACAFPGPLQKNSFPMLALLRSSRPQSLL